ncbi:MAG: hypothetical protein LM600_06920 [Thaumarchaeota archaeon]|jgi:ribosomal protein S27E|nr:hypothetical protein [Nitrososphaerota archaeon]
MCNHSRLIYLGAQKAYDGYNHYFKCLECGAVLVKLPSGKIFKIGGAGAELKEASAAPIMG